MNFFYGEKWCEHVGTVFREGIQLGPKKDGFIESDSILVQMFAIN
jgi:hypothetical protein